MLDPKKLKIGDYIRRCDGPVFWISDAYLLRHYQNSTNLSLENWEVITVTPVPYVEPEKRTVVVHWVRSKLSGREYFIAPNEGDADYWDKLGSAEVTITEGVFVEEKK
jgi:hypothetical protein